MAQALALLIVVAVGLWVFRMLSTSRSRLAPEEEAPRKKRPSRRERLVESLEEANPNPEIPSVFDLMMQEAEETGVQAIAGGESLPIPVKLKVWRRDAVIHQECPDRSALRFVVSPGIDPAEATTDDVRLACGNRIAGSE